LIDAFEDLEQMKFQTNFIENKNTTASENNLISHSFCECKHQQVHHLER